MLVVQDQLDQPRQQNVALFERMWLSLGADCVSVSERSSLRSQVDEALGRAARRWSLLVSMESQIPQDEARLKALERGRPPDAGDPWATKELLDRKDTAWKERVENERQALRQLKEQVKDERRELESWRVDHRKGK